MNTESVSFEDAFKRLEIIVKQLERGDASLEESLALFSEGASMISECKKQLASAEQVVKKLVVSDLGTVEEKDFNAEDIQ